MSKDESEFTPVETPTGKRMEGKIEALIFERLGEIKKDLSDRTANLRDDMREHVSALHADVKLIRVEQQQAGIAIAGLQGQLTRLQVQHDEYTKSADRRLDDHNEKLKELGKSSDRDISQVRVLPTQDFEGMSRQMGEAGHRGHVDTGVEKRLTRVEQNTADDLLWKAKISGAWRVIAGIAAAIVIVYGAAISTISVVRSSKPPEPQVVLLTQAMADKVATKRPAVTIPTQTFIPIQMDDANVAIPEPKPPRAAAKRRP
jgi:hypothetical protein